jgi:hypothetical protein
MVLDNELLQNARAAGAELGESERQALLARAEYHTAIRRLHLGGGSLREIAEALGLSHQRVQQIVNEAGGTWWNRFWRTRNATRDAVCTYCGHPPSEVAKLIAGPNVFICDDCVKAAERTLGPTQSPAHDRPATAPFVNARRSAKARCAFCSKKPAMLATAQAACVCADCLKLCREILSQRTA